MKQFLQKIMAYEYNDNFALISQLFWEFTSNTSSW